MNRHEPPGTQPSRANPRDLRIPRPEVPAAPGTALPANALCREDYPEHREGLSALPD